MSNLPPTTAQTIVLNVVPTDLPATGLAIRDALGYAGQRAQANVLTVLGDLIKGGYVVRTVGQDARPRYCRP